MEVNVGAVIVYLSTAPSQGEADKGTFTVYTATYAVFVCCKDSADH